MTVSEAQSRRRQPSIHLFALEYAQATLPEGGEGQYDPTFIVTKLGARVSRMMVAGVIDRMERRDGESGPTYRGQLRDPTGVHMFDIGHFQPELHGDAEELLARFERGDRFLMLMMGRARHWTNDEGSVYTSVRTESMRVIDRSRYACWLADAADATLRRIDAQERASDADSDRDSMRAAGVPEDLLDGLISARGHYGPFDAESYRVGVLHALAMASGRAEDVSAPSVDEDEGNDQESGLAGYDSAPSESEPELSEPPASADIDDIILGAIRAGDQGEGVHYDALRHACTSQGIPLQVFEDAIDDLRDERAEIMEPSFGWFQLTP